MHRRVFVAVLSISMLLVLFPSSSSAHTSTTSTAHDLVGRSLSRFQAFVFGRLTSTEPDCRGGEPVILRRGNGAVVGNDTTDGNGDYNFTVSRRLAGPPGPPGKDRIVVHVEYVGDTDTSYGHSHSCLSSNSRTMNIPDPPCPPRARPCRGFGGGGFF
jgi:hypothetical protein